MEEMRKKGQMIFALVFLFIIALGIFALIFLIAPKNNAGDKDINDAGSDDFCASDLECVPASCCHAISCVSIKSKPNCIGVFCTAVCEPGTLDCGQGSCNCVNNKCKAVFK